MNRVKMSACGMFACRINSCRVGGGTDFDAGNIIRVGRRAPQPDESRRS